MTWPTTASCFLISSPFLRYFRGLLITYLSWPCSWSQQPRSSRWPLASFSYPSCFDICSVRSSWVGAKASLSLENLKKRVHLHSSVSSFLRGRKALLGLHHTCGATKDTPNVGKVEKAFVCCGGDAALLLLILFFFGGKRGEEERGKRRILDVGPFW